MSLSVAEINLLLKLVEDHKLDIHIKMQENGYSIDQILNFIEGYTLVQHDLNEAVYNNVLSYDNDPSIIVFENHSDALKAFGILINKVRDNQCMYADWSVLGAKYLICLIRYYMNNVIYGNLQEVEDFYINISDKINSNPYKWDKHDWDYDFFNEEI
jgi:hypothetical protein